MRQPRWTIDEALLAVDTYFQIRDVRNITVDNPLVIELSETLRKMPIHNNTETTFRNLTGVKMQLYAIASLDESSRYSISNVSKTKKDVYCWYVDKKEELHIIAQAIVNSLPLPFAFIMDKMTQIPMMSEILYQFHRYIERDSKIAKILHHNLIERCKSVCYLCQSDLYSVYGNEGIMLLELHYGETIEAYSSKMQIMQNKFVLLCPTCHKYTHNDLRLFSKVNIKKINSIKEA